MGDGVWTTSSYNNYMVNTKGINDVRSITTDSVNEFYDAHTLDKALNPYGVKVRECCDSDEHPNTIPVILALDVTGSMGSACAAVARQLNEIITKLYESVTDVEFMVMGIGDFSYDHYPLQVSQFESDVRIVDQLGKIYFERGGGGNGWESYTSAWYFGARHTDLDCWKRGQKGIIITMGDEPLNPYLPKEGIKNFIGDNVESDIDTGDLWVEVGEKYDVYHIVITDPEASSEWYMSRIDRTFGKYFDGQHLIKANSDTLPTVISDIVTNHVGDFVAVTPVVADIGVNFDNDGAIVW